MTVKLGSVIVFLSPQNKDKKFIKRVAAMGADKIAIESGNVLLNGKIASELSVPEQYRRRDYSLFMKEFIVPEGHIFLLGDNRDNSRDSRFIGTVPVNDIVGKATYILFSKDITRMAKAIQ